MAIKRREHRPAVDSAAIDSFGDAADAPAEDQTPAQPDVAEAWLNLQQSHVNSMALRRTVKRADAVIAGPVSWPEDLAKSFLLRYPDPSIPLEIEQLQDVLGRSKHQTILLALRRGLDALRAEAEERGDSADLIS